MSQRYKIALSIAGSDPSGGAGIQADLKTFSALGCYGATAITAVVDENTVGVSGVHPIPVDFVVGQIDSVLLDIGSDAVKIGMLHAKSLIQGVSEVLFRYEQTNIVLDPVMVATSGDELMQQEAVDTLKEVLIPQVRLLTPNIPEAEVLLGQKIDTKADLAEYARALSCNRQVSVLLKAGHVAGEVLTDVLYNAEIDKVLYLPSPRIYTQNTHGTGCTLSSAITAYLALGLPLNQAVQRGKDYITRVLIAGAKYTIGKGHGPVHHFADFWE
ncbi:bifunctional hydroxymethylpyrimidine kinase/phosphomethylpyrimidine kinase [Myroides pelagicus]|uniref:hydroxymethylpyrimidine kinase n=1 Tax=Myroides pelagicus TaxID=270914 RepID=A0A7K1GN51_9FLAO|nr:bifunctional hydroxymethylpyrimidine kinase/phosphomethylpyrimidine kinase [Myroides pelagicus]MTH30271.1 bifunctional hydroxymethylpyrimidine kinase/phosphomethylpyrimidine kinase [Myroides pelagicus]